MHIASSAIHPSPLDEDFARIHIAVAADRLLILRAGRLLTADGGRLDAEMQPS